MVGGPVPFDVRILFLLPIAAVAPKASECPRAPFDKIVLPTPHPRSTRDRMMEEPPGRQIVEHLKRVGIDLVVSLPDQWLADLIGRLDADPAITHIKLAREDDGIGICAGAWLGGRKAALVCQNAG